MALLNVNVYNELDPTDKVETNISFTNTTTQVTFNTSNAKGSKVAFPDISNFFNARTGLTSFTFDSDFVDVPNSFVNCHNAFDGCSKLKSMPVIPTITEDAYSMYRNCNNMVGDTFYCPDTVINAHSMYQSCNNMVAEPVISDSVTDSAWMYSNAVNIIGSPVASESSTDCRCMYDNCLKLTGDAAVGSATIEANMMYCNCQKLDGKPNCPDSVVNANGMYMDAWLMTGDAECGASVVEALNMYRGCGIDGNAACGDSVVNAQNMFYYTPNLIGEAIVGASVVNAYSMYGDSPHVKRCANLPATVKNAAYMFRCGSADTKAAIYTDEQHGDLYSGIYHWDSDIIENTNGMWAASISGNSFCWPNVAFNAAHVKINQYYAGTTENTKTFNSLKAANCPISTVSQTWNATHKVLTFLQSNLFFHADPTWDYHEETAKIDDIDRIEIDKRGSNSAWKSITGYSEFLANEEPFMFIESDRVLYGSMASGDRPDFTIYYKDGTSKKYACSCDEWLGAKDSAGLTYGRGFGGGAYLFGIPHLAYSEMDKKYPENIYFSGDWSDLLHDTKITKYPVFQRADGYVYDNCWGKVNNFAYFFNNCQFLANNVNEFSGWNALDAGVASCYAMFRHCYNLQGEPYLHENMNNVYSMYDFCNHLVGFTNIPNFTTDGVVARGCFWTPNIRDEGLEPFAEGVWHCNYDNFSDTKDFVYANGRDDFKDGPTLSRNSLHLYVNHYYPGTTTLTNTFKCFRDNVICDSKPKDYPDYQCMCAHAGDSNFWIHYDEDRDIDAKMKDVSEVEIFMSGNLADSLNYLRNYYSVDSVGMHSFVEDTYAGIQSSRDYGIDYTARFADGTSYSNRTRPAVCWADRAKITHGWLNNQVVAFGFPWWIVSNINGHEKRPDAFTYSGDWHQAYQATKSPRFPWSEEYGHNFFYKVTNARLMFADSKNIGYGSDLFEDFSDLNFGMATDCYCLFSYTNYLKGDFSQANFDSAINCESMFQNTENIIPPNLPNATNLKWFMNNSRNSVFDCTGYNFGRDDGTCVSIYKMLQNCYNATGELYLPVTTTGDYTEVARDTNINTLRFNSDATINNFGSTVWNTSCYQNLNVYLPNSMGSSPNIVGTFGWETQAMDSLKAEHELHIYDPYYQVFEKAKTSAWYSHFVPADKVYKDKAFGYWTTAMQARQVTWTDYPDKGYLYNEQYNIYYHYSDITMTLIPLPDDVKALFADGTITKFVAD